MKEDDLLNTLGLGKIFLFSIFTGLSFGFAYKIGGTDPELGFSFTILNLFSNYIDSSIQVLIMLISSLFAIFFIFRLASFFRQVYEHRLVGAITSILGFFGSFLVMLGQLNNFQLIGLGIGFWVIGLTLVVSFTKRNQVKSYRKFNLK